MNPAANASCMIRPMPLGSGSRNNFLVKIWFLWLLWNVITVYIRQLIVKIEIPAVNVVGCRVEMVIEVVTVQRIVL